MPIDIDMVNLGVQKGGVSSNRKSEYRVKGKNTKGWWLQLEWLVTLPEA